MSGLRLLLLGPPRLERDNAPVNLERRKALALLAYLAVTGEPQSREALATLLWPDHDESQAPCLSAARPLHAQASAGSGAGGDWARAHRAGQQL